MGFRKSRNEAPQAVCCNCGLQTDQKTVEERSADSPERRAPRAYVAYKRSSRQEEMAMDVPVVGSTPTTPIMCGCVLRRAIPGV